MAEICDILIQLSVILILIAINAAYVAAEFALLNSKPLELRTIIDEHKAKGKTAGWACRLLEVKNDSVKFDNYVTVVQVGVTCSSLGLGVYSEHALAGLFIKLANHFNIGLEGTALAGTVHGAASIMSLLLLTYIHVVAGEMIPKTAALHKPLQAAQLTYGFMCVSNKLLHWLALLLTHITNCVLRRMDIPVQKDLSQHVSKETLDRALETFQNERLIDDEAGDWAREWLHFGDEIVRSVMVPRTQVLAFQGSTTVQEALCQVRQYRCSRYPVYEEDLDDTNSMVLVRDLYRAMRDGKGGEPVRLHSQPYPIMHELITLDLAFKEMCAQSVHMAAVVDEKGGIAGIVTMEDLFEEVVGYVYDEFEGEERQEVSFDLGCRSWEVEGVVSLEDLIEDMGEALEEQLIASVSETLSKKLRPKREKDLRRDLGRTLLLQIGEQRLSQRLDELVQDEIEKLELDDFIDSIAKQAAKEHMKDVADKLDDNFKNEKAETVGGLVMSLLGKLPAENDRVLYKNALEFRVLEVKEHAPSWLEIPVLNPDSIDDICEQLRREVLDEAQKKGAVLD
ncbi:MAG: hemolysin family protein [Candidatus Bruticola sp.]